MLIVGASIAGLTLAENLRSEGYEGSIVLVGEEKHPPYNRPPLSKQILMGAWQADQAIIKDTAELAKLNIEFKPETRALALDVDRKVVLTNRGVESYDQLVIATGTKARKIPGTSLNLLRTLDDAVELRARFEAANHIAVIGAGVLGSEIASAARHFGKKVTLISKTPEISFGSVGTALSKHIEDLHLSNGVDLRLELDVSSVETKAEQQILHFQNGDGLEVDLVVAAIGAIPCTDWLVDSGLEISNGVRCDASGQAAEGIYAIGDVAAWADPANGEWRRIEHQTNAIDQAMAVAKSIVGKPDDSTPVPFFWSDLHGVSIKAYGWFSDCQLTETKFEADYLFTALRNGEVQGVLGWNLPHKEFRAARLLVDESIAKTYSNQK